MPSIGNISAWILVGGERLPEYKVESAENIVKCHIPSEAGKTFRIGFGERGGLRMLDWAPVALVELDGHDLNIAWALLGGVQERIIEGLAGMDSFQPFAFANLQVTEDGGDESVSGGLGFIKVKIDWRRYSGPGNGPLPVKKDLQNPDPVHEKKKKLTTHRVVLGEKVHQTNVWNRYAPIPGSPKYEFHFQYASKDLLMAHGIIPKPPTLLDLPDSYSSTSKRAGKRRSEVIDLTTDDEDASQPLQGKKARLGSPISRTVKREIKDENSRVARFTGVIDLTEDD